MVPSRCLFLLILGMSDLEGSIYKPWVDLQLVDPPGVEMVHDTVGTDNFYVNNMMKKVDSQQLIGTFHSMKKAKKTFYPSMISVVLCYQVLVFLVIISMNAMMMTQALGDSTMKSLIWSMRLITQFSPLHLLFRKKDEYIIHQLLSTQISDDIDPKDNKGGLTPLHLAVKSKRPQIVEMLIEIGTSVDNMMLGKLGKIPGFDLASIKVVRSPLVRETSPSVMETLVERGDKAERGGNEAEQKVLQQFKDPVLDHELFAMGDSQFHGNYTMVNRVQEI